VNASVLLEEELSRFRFNEVTLGFLSFLIRRYTAQFQL
jgi:hypothetical protein